MSMETLLVLPILIPFATAILDILAWDRVKIQRQITLLGMTAFMLAGFLLLYKIERDGIRAVQIGDWPAPFGITIVADLFSAIMVAITGLIGFSVSLYSLSSIDDQREQFGYYPLISTLLMGVSGAFLTGDLFNMYVWFEVLLISSFVLLALGGEREQLSGAIQYVVLNLVSSSIFLAAVGMLYSVTGTLNMADLARQLEHVEQPGIVPALAVMFLVTFGIKAAMFPLFFWLPVSYHTPPITVSAIFAGLLTKVGVYAMIRVFTLLFVQNISFTHTIILTAAGLTMITGVLGAAAEYDFRRVLSFHIISQIGYMLMGLGLFTPLALAGSIFYLIHHIIVKTNLFLISGIAHRLRGSFELKLLGGLYRDHPLLGGLFLIPALSLAGIPPLSGFWAKLILIRSGLEVKEYLIVGVALAVSAMTLYSMIKIWIEAFLKDQPNPPDEDAPTPKLWQASLIFLVIPVLILAAATVAIGVLAQPVFELSQEAANQLMNPTAYIETVCGVNRCEP
jgi:multicomponent Na+:H+ antiporter subunit D